MVCVFGPRTVRRGLGAAPPLRSLALEGCPLLMDWMLPLILERVPALEALNVSACHRLTDNALSIIAEMLPGLKRLDVHHVTSITDLGVAVRARLVRTAAVKRGPGANAGRPPCVCTWAGSQALASGCTALEALDISSCTRLTTAALVTLCTFLPRLHSLRAAMCRAMSDDVLPVLAQLRPTTWRELVLDGVRFAEADAAPPLDGRALHTLSLRELAAQQAFRVDLLTTAPLACLGTAVASSSGCDDEQPNMRRSPQRA